MLCIDKISVFRKELDWIKSPSIKAFAETLVTHAPDYFFEVQASSSGRFHPEYALGRGGLVRHTLAATSILHELLGLEMFDKYSQDQKDMMITSIMAHDFFKHGLAATAGKYTTAEHPLVCANYIRDHSELTDMLEPGQVDFICGCIASHMGQFNTKWNSHEEILPKPKTGPQNLVHLADYLASRKYLIFDFGDDYYQPDQKEEPSDDGGNNEELNAAKEQLVKICKEKIAAGVAQKDLYTMIAEANGGNRNPNSITDISVANNLLHKLEGLNV